MRIRPFPRRTSNPESQHGSAILIILTIIGLGAAFMLVSALNKANSQIGRDKITAAALAQAKDALIGYAASVDISGTKRPGDLPCPDNHPPGDALEGTPSTPCNASALGRLPWKTLGLADLRDSAGERLWYAISTNFKNNTRTGTLNSDTNGTITIRDSTGAIVNNGADSTAAIAVIISPGNTLTRQDGVNQARDAANANNPVHYLDIGNGEDNAAFVDSGTDGFIQGPINAAGVTISNDRLLTITPNDLMPTIEKRVAGEVRTCLTEYAEKPSNQGRYPWAAPLNQLAAPSYSDVSGSRFGRIPDTPFAITKSDSGNVMDDSWTGNCNINSGSGWWLNWKDLVFYAVADAYKPAAILPGCGTTGTCLVVNPPSATADKRFAVFMASKRLSGVSGGQPRTTNADKGTITNYLEDQNATPPDNVFTKYTPSATFNDYVLYQ